MRLSRLLPLNSLNQLTELTAKEDPFIDGLRGLSVLMVVWFHTLYAVNFGFDPAFFQAYLAQFPAALRFVLGTDKAVDIFFMISAFLLASSLRRQAMEQRLRVGSFYIQRAMRIYPLFLMALAVFALTVRNPLEKLPANLLFIDNFTGQTIIPVGWSLSVEMQCYLVLPWVIWLAHKSQRPLLALAALLMATLAWRLHAMLSVPASFETPFVEFAMETADSSVYMDTLYYSTPGRVSSFVVGLIWAYSLHHAATQRFVERLTAHPLLATTITLALLATAISTMYFPVYLAEAAYYQHFSATLNFWIVWLHRAVFTLALLGLILLIHWGGVSRLLSTLRGVMSLSVWRVFSKLAFPIYLFHFPFIVVGWLLVLRTTDLDSISQIGLGQTLLAAFFTTILVTWFALPLHFWIEQKGIALGKRWSAKR